MTVEVAEDLRNALNDYANQGDAPPAVTLVELALCTDASFTEATDGAYNRVDLTVSLAGSDGGENIAAFAVDVGADVVTHWQILHDNVWKIRGPLLDSFTGAKSIDLDGLMRGSSL